MLALVVDDSTAMRRILTRTMEGLGWEVKAATNGVEALAALKALEHCELILTDWHMPEMDGLELCRAIRQDEKHGDVHILVVTSDAVMESIQVAIDAGADDFVMKPFTPEALSERITEVMSV